MPALSFKKQFVPFIEDGSKQHTIRAERSRAFRIGDTLHLYTAMRTKQCRLLMRVPCIKVATLRMELDRVWINDNELSPDEKDLLAWTDGFRLRAAPGTYLTDPTGCFHLMLEFWANTHGEAVFSGNIIHWDFKKGTGAAAHGL